MIWILCLVTAAIGYVLGNINTLTLASRFVFKKNLRKLGSGNIFLSNFRRIYGWKGAVKLLITELVVDIIPVLLGGFLLGIKELAPAGQMLGAFCVIVGKLYPALNYMHGTEPAIAIALAGFFVDPSAGIAVIVAFAAIAFFTKHIAWGDVAAAFMLFVVTMLVGDDDLVFKITAFVMGIVIFHHIPAISRMLGGREEKISLKADLSYKFDEKFQ